MKKVIAIFILLILISPVFAGDDKNIIEGLFTLSNIISSLFILLLAITVSVIFNKRNINKLIEERVASIVKRNRDVIRDVVHNEEIENKVRNEVKFLVITTQERKRELERLFDKLKFNENLRVEERSSFNPQDKADIFVFDMMYNEEATKLINEYIANVKNILGIVLSENSSLDVVCQNRDKLTAANSEFVLYARIMELGKYHITIKK